ncbi:MAG: PH domain-containing protein [Candidatus Saccharimonadales bacterium]
MNPNQPVDQQLQNINNPLGVTQPGERLVCEIKRHPIGIIGTYVTSAIVVVAVCVAAILAPEYIEVIRPYRAALALGAIIITVISLLFAYVAAVVYKGNRWIVTSDSITQVEQTSLFNKKSSQLSMANLEDVTYEQNGIFQSMFGYGVIRAESAGDRSKFMMIYCPHPGVCAKQIISAHEEYIAQKPSEMVSTNRSVANTQNFNQPYGPPASGPAQPEQFAEHDQPPVGPNNYQPPSPVQSVNNLPPANDPTAQQ